jgi:hypothetical protein
MAGPWCDKPWWQNVAECEVSMAAPCNGGVMCCIAWATAVSAGFGCGADVPPPETPPADEPVDEEAYEAAPVHGHGAG